MKKMYNVKTLLGSAEWANLEEKIDNSKYTLDFFKSSLFIGSPIGSTQEKIFINTKNHLLCSASSRSGKSTTVIVPNLLHSKFSAVVTDPKGELAYLTARRRHEMGQEIFIADPFGEINRHFGDPFKGCGFFINFDILSSISKEEIYPTVSYLAEALIIDTSSDPHWSKSSREFVMGILAYIIESQTEKASLARFRSIITGTHEEIVKVAFISQDEGKFSHKSIARQKLARFADPKLAENRELCSIISTANTQTAFLDDPALKDFFSSTTPEFSLDCLVNNDCGTTIYLVLPYDKLKSHGRWLRLLLSLALKAAFYRKNNEHNILFLLDEFSSIGPLPPIIQALTMGAEYKILLWIFVQSLTQLQDDYPSKWEFFMSNCEHQLFFNTMDLTTAEYLSRLLGKTTISMTYNNCRPSPPFPTMTISSPIIPETASPERHFLTRDLLDPSEICRLPSNYGILLTQGNKPILYEKIPYYQDPLFADFAPKDIRYPD
jgi:type IV secretion system protein VirD4